jgi:hypothetical protein
MQIALPGVSSMGRKGKNAFISRVSCRVGAAAKRAKRERKFLSRLVRNGFIEKFFVFQQLLGSA